MTEPVLTTRQLNRALLARQLLLEPSKLPLAAALEQIGGLQTQYAPSGYIGLWSRLADFGREDLTRALEERRAVQGTLMRVTIHTVSSADYWPMVAAIREARRTWWLGISQRQAGRRDMEVVAEAVREELADGPLRVAELTRRLTARGFPPDAMQGVGLWVDLARVPPSGTWDRRRADLYGLADAWLPQVDIREEEGREHLVRRYLGAFGPAPLHALASWAGLRATAFGPAVAKVADRRFRDERGTELLDLSNGPLPDPETPAPIRFLPTWDATLLIHARRTQILPEQHRSRIFNTKTPHSVSTFLVDGRVAGTWRYDEGRVELTPFAKLTRAERTELEGEAERLAAFHAA
ncbi:MAG: winged helix DNA-binding domain-containing protein [Chloroflexota bacterium]|nr:winged helix DNA-binding domain-containing protein [Chloroflexota bacterium]